MFLLMSPPYFPLDCRYCAQYLSSRLIAGYHGMMPVDSDRANLLESYIATSTHGARMLATNGSGPFISRLPLFGCGRTALG